MPLLGKPLVQQLVLTALSDVTLAKLLTLRVNKLEKSIQIPEKYMNIVALASRLLKQNWCNLSHFWEMVVIWWSGWVGKKLQVGSDKSKNTLKECLTLFKNTKNKNIKHLLKIYCIKNNKFEEHCYFMISGMQYFFLPLEVRTNISDEEFRGQTWVKGWKGKLIQLEFLPPWIFLDSSEPSRLQYFHIIIITDKKISERVTSSNNQ